MERIFFRIQRRLEREEPISKWLIEEFLYSWKENFSNHAQFVLSHYFEINTLLQLALSHTDSYTHTNRTDFLLRYETLSLCLDHFDRNITPCYFRRDINTNTTAIRNSHQSLLSRWDGRTCLELRTTASSDGESSGPGRTEIRSFEKVVCESKFVNNMRSK